MFIKVSSIANIGLSTTGVDVEINMASRGLPVFEIIGLGNKSIEESKERVKTAIVNSKIEFPKKRITVNLAPADISKEGSFYDLPIATGILSFILNFEIPQKSLFFGELSLDGKLRHTRGSLLLALFAKEKGIKNIFVPRVSANEAAIVEGINVFPVDNLGQLVAFLMKKTEIKKAIYKDNRNRIENQFEFDMSEIIGQQKAKRAMEIASSGGHNIFMMGSPGSGKTMIAKAMSGILPMLSKKESLEATKIYSVSGNIPPEGSIIKNSPFRSPHHSVSMAGIIGGGTNPSPGEVSLAHRGVLFLDEFAEFPRSVLEALRQPIEDGEITISRSKARIKYPARFILVASANPCPCGYLFHPKKECICSDREVRKYRKRVSGPILDRIDLHLEVPIVEPKDVLGRENNNIKVESSSKIRERVIKTREVQRERFLKEGIFTNAEMRNSHIKKYCPLSKEANQILTQAMESFNLSARGYLKTIKIARTIADMEEKKDIKINHIAEALQYKFKDEHR